MTVRGNGPFKAPEIGAPTTTTKPSSSVVAARAILLVLAAGGATFAFVLPRQEVRSVAGAQRRYACPMHREVISAAPGECPICGMALRVSESDPAVPPSRRASILRQQGFADVARRRIFSLPVRGPAWLQRDGIVRALLYDDEVALLLPAERGLFRPSAAPGPPLHVRLAAGQPAPWDASTSTVDFHVEGDTADVQVGTAGWLELAARPRTFLVIPSAAVLQSSDGPYVVASADGRTFSRRPIKAGKTMFGLAAVVSGLNEHELVAVRSAFFLDAERLLGPRAGSTPAVDR